jgi:hypothetical protein
MKKTTFYTIAALLIAGFSARAQDFHVPQPSTKQVITQDFGMGKITLTYSRPNVKGRKIFGEVEPYNLVWRTGANNATTIQLTDEVTIEGNKVPAGEYALFSIPGENEWTIILNKTAKQWGAYAYDEKADLLRFKVKPSKMDQLTETLTMQFAEMNINSGVLHIMWDHTDLPIHFVTDVDKQVMDGIDKAMQSENKPYYFAAIYYYNNNKDMAKALEWMNIMDAKNSNTFNFKYWKARIQLKMGDKKGALATARQGYDIAVKENSAEYMRLNNDVIAQASVN